jgi:hypothetical protein
MSKKAIFYRKTVSRSANICWVAAHLYRSTIHVRKNFKKDIWEKVRKIPPCIYCSDKIINTCTSDCKSFKDYVSGRRYKTPNGT